MNWILLVFLIYTLVGASLVARNLRGMHVSASVREWAMLLLLWPFMLRFFLQMSVLQARIDELERWADSEKNKH